MGPRAGLDVYEKSRPHRDSMTALSVYTVFLTATHFCEQHKRNAAIRFHGNDGYVNARQCYVIRTLVAFFFFK
jgi:hypothetical protein